MRRRNLSLIKQNILRRLGKNKSNLVNNTYFDKTDNNIDEEIIKSIIKDKNLRENLLKRINLYIMEV